MLSVDYCGVLAVRSRCCVVVLLARTGASAVGKLGMRFHPFSSHGISRPELWQGARLNAPLSREKERNHGRNPHVLDHQA
jgi:hypothetical protein